MNSAKRKILKEIDKRITNAKKRQKDVDSTDYTPIVFSFFKKVEEIYKVASHNIEFDYLLTEALHIMGSKLNSLDNEVNIELQWNEGSTWKDLRLHGITLIWSKNFLSKNKEIEPKIYIDITDYLLTVD